MGVTQRSLGRTQVVSALALSGLVACAGFGVRAAGTRVSAAPATLAQVSALQGSGQAGQGSTASQAPTRGGPDTTKQAPSQPTAGRGSGLGGLGSGWEWWKDEAVKKEIGLRPDQATLIDHIYTKRVKDMDPVLQAYDQEKATLEKMIADRVVDDTQLSFEITTKYLPLWSNLVASRQMMLYRISKVLDVEQFAKLKAINEQHQQLMAGRRGRGGAPAPHPLDLLR